jgi:hypothetical protein
VAPTLDYFQRAAGAVSFRDHPGRQRLCLTTGTRPPLFTDSSIAHSGYLADGAASAGTSSTIGPPVKSTKPAKYGGSPFAARISKAESARSRVDQDRVVLYSNREEPLAHRCHRRAGKRPRERLHSKDEIEVVVDQPGDRFRWCAIIKLKRAQTILGQAIRRFAACADQDERGCSSLVDAMAPGRITAEPDR